MNKASTINQTIEGYYRVAVVDGQTNQVVWEQPELKKNLILNQGLDQVYTTYYAELMRFAVAGLGTRLNYLDPAGSMLSQTGTTITLIPTGSGGGLNHLTESYGQYSSALSVGDVIKYTTGSGGVTEVTVTGVSDLTASVNTSLTISPSQSFTIWKTSQTGLQSEARRAGGSVSAGDLITGTQWLVGSSNCNSVDTSTGRTYYRTYDFQTQSLAATYAEIGVAWSGTIGSATVFSRVVLPSTVFVDVGQRLRVFYQMNVTLSPTSSVSRPNVTVSGWPVSPATNTNGSESIQNIVMSSITSATGNSDTSGTALEPASSGVECAFWISMVSSSLQPFGSAISRVGTSPTAALANSTKNSYSNGSYTCDKSAIITAASWDGTNIRSMGFGDNSANSATGTTSQAFCFLFEQTQSKTNTQTLSLGYRWTWGRTLSN
jgi:hypothetical protein